MTRSLYSLVVNRKDVSSVLLDIYASILSTSLSVTIKEEDTTDLSGLTRELFFTDIQEKYFDGNIECVPRVNSPNMPVVIFRRHYVHYHRKNIFSLLCSNWNVPNIHSQSIFAISSID